MGAATGAYAALGTNSRQNAGRLCRDLWGGGCHIGIFEHSGETLDDALARVATRLDEGAGLAPGQRVLNVGCGHGAIARRLAALHGCRVVAADTSPLDLTWGEALARTSGLGGLVTFVKADMHHLPYETCSFDIYWAQECFRRARSKHLVLEEAARVLKPGGRLVLTDLVVRRPVTPRDRAAIATEVSWPDMWDSDDYRLALREAGFTIDVEHDWSDCIASTYNCLISDLERRRREFEAHTGREAVNQAAAAFRFWSRAADEDKIGWVHMRARRL